MRLNNWARWMARGGAGGLGYATTNWTAFDSGDRYGTGAAPIVPDGEEAITDQAVRTLEPDLLAAINVTYLEGGSHDQKARRLACHPMTLWNRVNTAHRRIGSWLGERERAGQAERDRVEQLQRDVAAGVDRRQADASQHAKDVARPVKRRPRGGFTPLS
jgi:predicted DNA-binding protein (UPF0251 family)